jgi:gliding motility-associated GldN-like protein
MSREELFESRMFASRIIKSTVNNPNDEYIRSYIKDPILALLEGENMKDRIFNYEQDLWSY